jgi:hypothetical protein
MYTYVCMYVYTYAYTHTHTHTHTHIGVQLQPVTRAVKTHKVAANNQLRLCEQLLQINHLRHQHLVPMCC